MKLLDYALCDEPTEKRAVVHVAIADAPTERMPAIRTTCDGFPFEHDCGASVERDGLCALHYYKLMSFLKWEAMWKEYAS